MVEKKGGRAVGHRMCVKKSSDVIEQSRIRGTVELRSSGS